jgi:hypothetical protein
MKPTKWVIWEEPSRRASEIKVKYIDHFDAPGMRLVYGRGDHYGGGRTFNMDVWRTRSGRLLVRFWSRSVWVDEASLEVIGFSPRLPPRRKGAPLDARWVPQCLRDEYDAWIDSAETT